MTTHKEINDAYDRVTDILYQFSGLTKIDPSILSNAATRGTIIHLACECIINGLPIDDIQDDYQGYIDSFQLWAVDKTFKPKPARFYDDELMITGECDGIYEKDGNIVLFDLKTPVREGSTWGMQGSAYAYLAGRHDISIDKVEFIRLKKDGTYPTIYVYPDLMDDFRVCLNVYRRFFKNQTTNLKDF